MYLLLQFTKWKTCLEKSTTGSFIQHTGEKMRKDKKYLNFYCNRSGQSCKRYKTDDSKLRASKSQGIHHRHRSTTGIYGKSEQLGQSHTDI